MLKKKVLRDILNNKMQFFTIFLMIFLGVFVFAGIHAYMDGMRLSAEVFYTDYNLEDLVLSGSFTEDSVTNILELDNINDVSAELELTMSVSSDKSLDVMFINNNIVSKMYVSKGEGFSNTTGIWIDEYYALNNNLSLGDTITLTYNDITLTEEIKGFIYTPDHVYTIENSEKLIPDHENYGYAYISITELDDEYQMYNKILVDVFDTTVIDDVKRNIVENIEEVQIVLEKEEITSYARYRSECEEGETYSVVFTLIFLFIAVFCVISTMNRFIKKERIQIGTLKALGFKDRKITFTYLSYSLYLSIVAVVLGIIMGYLTLGNYFLHMQMSYYMVPNYKLIIKPIVYIVCIFVIIIVVLITYLSTKKILKMNVSDTLRLEPPKVRTRKLNITTRGLFKYLSISTRWNLRDISRNIMRTLTGILGIAGATMLIVAAFGFKDTINYWIDLQYSKVYSFDYKINLIDEYTIDEYNELTSTYGNKTSMDIAIEIDNNGVTSTNLITVNDAEGYLNNINEYDEVISLKDGINITKKLADELNLKVGNTLKFRIYGTDNWYQEAITNIVKDNQSQQVYINKSTLDNLDVEYNPDTIYTNIQVETSSRAISSVESIEDLKYSMEDMIMVMNQMIYIFIIASVILGVVIIYNLGILSLSENIYHFATLKVIGFKDRNVKRIYVKQNIWITILAIIIGLPLGYFVVYLVYTYAISSDFDLTIVVSNISYIWAILGTIILSLLVNLILAKKINKIDMVSTLKGGE